MNRQLLRDTLGWGFILWLIGYVIGMVLFSIVPLSLIGWIIMPIGIAIIFDYFFLVKLLKPADGYYKLDVYLYYALTFILPH